MYQDKTVLLIAGGGTLGTYAARELLSKGCFVDVICLNDPQWSHERLRFIKANADLEFLSRHLQEHHYNGIVNFIHYPDVEEYKPVHRLLSANTDHLIFLSSYRIYADSSEPITEETPTLLDTSRDADFLRDKTYYALAKAAGEKYLREESQTANWTAVRPVISFSASRLDVVTRSGRAVVECARSGEVFELPLQARNLTAGLDWAGNSGKLIANLLFKKHAHGQSYTISSAQNLTWGQVADIYRELTGVKIAWIDTQTYLEKHNQADPYFLLYDRLFDRKIDNSKVLEATGLTHEDFLPIREGIRIELDKLRGNFMDKIRIAQIGTSQNSHGSHIINCLKRHSDIFEIVGYALPEGEREKFPDRMADFESLREMTVEEILEDPTIEAVTVETEEIYLTKYAQMAADSGKHIHMEKPGSRELAAFEKLISTMKRTGKVFHTGYMYRYNPYVKELLEQVERGELGQIISVEAQMNCLHTPRVRQWLENLPGGMMFFLGCHLIDLIFRIQGKPERIIPLNKCSGIDGVTARDFGMAVFEYEKGISFAKASAVELGGFARRQLVVSGTKATVELNPLEWYVPDTDLLQTSRVTRESALWHEACDVQISPAFDRYNDMMRSFAQMVRGEKENPYTCDYELELYKTILKACGEEV